MCIDAPGSTGFGYYPHMATAEKSSEPEKHKLLKTKATAVKIHGVGVWLAQTYPKLEQQGIILLYTLYSVYKNNNTYNQVEV